MFRYSPMSPILLLRHVLFGFNLDQLRILPRVFKYILNVSKFCICLPKMTFAPVLSSPAPYQLLRALRRELNSIEPSFSIIKGLRAVVVSSLVAGGPMASFRLLFTSPCFVYFCTTYAIVFVLAGVGIDSLASLARWCTPF